MTRQQEINICELNNITPDIGGKFSLKICSECRAVKYTRAGSNCDRCSYGYFEPIEEEDDWTDEDERALRSRGIDI